MDRHFRDREIWIVFGVMRDKDVAEIASELFPVAKRLILTRANQQRSLQTDAIRAIFPHPDTRACEHVSEAIALLQEAPADAVIFITGSLFVVGEARPLLQ
jgi:folylpolyglutamate synthase/dihydropteroate synthase